MKEVGPHGGRLVERLSPPSVLSELAGVPRLSISRDAALDMENIGTGVYSPLDGFMCSEEFISVVRSGRLPDGVPWTIPIVLDVDEEQLRKQDVREADTALLEHQGVPVGLLEVEEIYRYDRKEYAQRVFCTMDHCHPGVCKVLSLKDVLVGGKISFIQTVDARFPKYDLTPRETREHIRKMGWQHVVGFQTRNAPHLGHEFVQKSALMVRDTIYNGKSGLFVNPVIGRKKGGDFTDEAILAGYEALLSAYYPKHRTLLGIWKTEMRYAGPREAVFHAIVRKNFGCTHFIVGRDHAGVGDYYKPYEAQEVFKQYPDLGIVPLFFKAMFYCKRCGGVVSEDICPHDEQAHIKFSGTSIRQQLTRGIVPHEMLREEVARALLGIENPFVEVDERGEKPCEYRV